MTTLQRCADALERRFAAATVLMLALLFAWYNLEYLRFRPYDVDNPWFLSFSYGWGVDGVSTDQFLYQEFPNGMDGTHLFGKTAAALQTWVLRPFDWQARPAVMLSALLVVASLGCLAAALRRLRLPASAILPALLAAGISEPVLAAAERFRYEPVSMLLGCAGLLLATYDYTFAAVMLASVAIEVQPIALLVVVPVATLCLIRRPRLRTVLLILAGGCTAAAYLLALHPEFLHPAHLLVAARRGYPAPLGQLSYFLLPRHWLEMLLPVIALILVLRRGKDFFREQLWLLISCAALLVAALLFKHTNADYIVFLYPWLLLVLFVALKTLRGRAIALALCCLYFLPQYALAAWLNRGQGYRAADIRQVRSMLDATAVRLGRPPEDLKILGNYSLWFAHPHNFHAGFTNTSAAAGMDVYLCYAGDLPGLSQPKSIINCDRLMRSVPHLRLDSTASVRGNILSLYVHETTAAPAAVNPSTESQ